MPFTRTATLRALRIICIIALVGLIATYAVWRSFNYAQGPKITIYEPLDGSSIATSTMTVSGRAERVVSLSMNGKVISVDEQGDWKETLIVFPGLNTVTFSATDRFGRSIDEDLKVVGMQ